MVLVAGVDSSTQSCKVELRDLETGRLMGRGSAPHAPAYGPCSEQNPHEWWDAFKKALNQAVEISAQDRKDIVAISVGAQCHGFVPLDVHEEVIRPAKLWNDTQSAPQLQKLRGKIGAETWIEAVGSLPTASFTIGKIAWLAENEPDHFARLRKICLPHDWLTLRLCGRHVTDRSDASGTGYYNARKNCYELDFLSLIDSDKDWASMLPEVLGPDDAAGVITKKTAEELGLRPDVMIGPGGGDQHAASLGLAVGEGDIVYTIATSGVAYTSSKIPLIDKSGFVDGVANCVGGFTPMVCTLNAARVTDWMAKLLNVDHAELSRMALEADPLSGPSFAAFFDGERKPNRPEAKGVIAGLTAATSRSDLARAAYEGVLLALVRGERLMNKAGIRTDKRVLITGGGARSAAYRQILADFTGRDVFIADPVDADEATARGAAIQAAAIVSKVPVEQMRQQWAPRFELAASPSSNAMAYREDVLKRYITVADWAGFDVFSV